jgi:hypothetical protein
MCCLADKAIGRPAGELDLGHKLRLQSDDIGPFFAAPIPVNGDLVAASSRNFAKIVSTTFAP